jgi:hypothetical protein B2_07677|nr:MAG TPA: hypothetical protein [Caudoviricetes sp.]
MDKNKKSTSMKVNFNQTVKDFKGNSTDIVISDKLAELLFFAGNSDFHMTREEKWRAYKISQKLIAGDGTIDMEVEDATMIKEVCAQCLAAGVFGQICDIIEEVEQREKKGE